MNGTGHFVKNKRGTLLVFLAVLLCALAPSLVLSPPLRADDGASGARAVTNGQALERLIESAIVARDFTAVSHADWAAKPSAYPTDVLVKNAPFTTVYGSQGHTEFVVKSPRLNGDIRIEAKWQQTPGSVDEKLPYLYLNASRFDAMPEAHVIIVIDGAGWREGALAWLRQAAQTPPPGKRIDVFDLAQFLAWANTL